MNQHKTAVVAGATGLIGKALLYQLLEDQSYLQVIACVRKEFPVKHPKLKVVVVDYNQLDDFAHELKADEAYCCLGTTINDAGSKQAFRLVDETYVLNFAKLCLKNSVSSFFIVTAMGANAQSAIFYNKVKGEVEQQLMHLGFDKLAIFRPSLLLGSRAKLRVGEWFAQKTMKPLTFLFMGALLKYKPVDAIHVAKAMCIEAKDNRRGNYFIENDAIHRMVKG